MNEGMKLQSRWPRGFKAGNLVWRLRFMLGREDKNLMAKVVECLPGVIPEGTVPVIYLSEPHRVVAGIVPVPADDLELLMR